MSNKKNCEILEILGLGTEKNKELEKRLIDKYGDIKTYEELSDVIWKKVSNECRFFEQPFANPYAYDDDVEIAVYMLMGYHCNGKHTISGEMRDVIDKMDEDGNIRKKGDRGRWDKEALKYFPFYINDKDYKITDWCRKYQETLFTFRNYDIFNLKKNNENDITRYGYQKAKEIYNSLKEESIENIFLLDATLGLSLTQTIYSVVKDLKQKRDLEKLNEIIECIAKMPCIYIRNVLAAKVFYYIKSKNYSEKVIERINKKISKVSSTINELFWALVQFKWLEYDGEKISRDEMKEKKVKLTQWWDSYYDDEVLYLDMLEYLGLPKLSENRNKYKTEEMEKYQSLSEFYTKSSPIWNKVFNAALEEGNNIEEVLFSDMVERVRKINQESFEKTIVIKKGKIKLDILKIYALIHKNVMKASLSEWGQI